MEQIRELVFYRHYFQEFFDQQTEKVKEKIDYVLFVVTHAVRIPEKFLKHLEGQKDSTKSELKSVTISFAFFAVLTKARLSFSLTAFKRRLRKHQNKKFNWLLD